MKGRHRSRPSPGGKALRAVAAALAVLLVLAGSWYGFRKLSQPACAGSVTLTVGTAAELQQPVQDQANEWAAKNRLGDDCVTFDVTAADPADLAAAIAGQSNISLNGVGQANGKTKVPDVWIPDSSTWLVRMRTAKYDKLPKDTPSVARSPIVLAVPEPIAASLAGAAATPGKLAWTDLLKKVASGDTKTHIGIVDPNRDASGLEGLLAMAVAAQSLGGAAGQQASTGALRALAQNRSVLRDELLRKFPRASDPASLASGLTLAPLSEQAVVAYDAAQPPVRLVPVYVNPASSPLDYPWVALSTVAGTKAQAAAALKSALATDTFKDRLAAVGLRGADGTAGKGFQVPTGAPPTVAAPGARDAATIEKLLGTWQSITVPSRMLAVIDVSGSMKELVPTAGNVTRMAVTLAAARQGMSLFDDSWAVGLWTFSTQLDGEKNYKQLVPIGPLTSQRPALLQALNGVKPKDNGNTALYETITAGYKAVLEGWDEGRVNSLVVMTDGANDDPGGATLEGTLVSLKQLVDPKKPIAVILIGIGTGVSVPQMKQITDVTGGGTFVAPDPAKIGEIFLQAIALRSATK